MFTTVLTRSFRILVLIQLRVGTDARGVVRLRSHRRHGVTFGVRRIHANCELGRVLALSNLKHELLR